MKRGTCIRLHRIVWGLLAFLLLATSYVWLSWMAMCQSGGTHFPEATIDVSVLMFFSWPVALVIAILPRRWLSRLP